VLGEMVITEKRPCMVGLTLTNQIYSFFVNILMWNHTIVELSLLLISYTNQRTIFTTVDSASKVHTFSSSSGVSSVHVVAEPETF
jgi:hypothetical protein